MILSDLEKEFLPVGLIRGSVFLLPPTEALRFVEECKGRGVLILGVEGFKVFGEKIQPLQEHSFDLYGQDDNSHCIATEFISKRLGYDIWFEVGTEGIKGTGPY